MTRYARKVDNNQREIVDALAAIGANVVITSGLGLGYPDLTVHYKNHWHLLEVKSKYGKLTEAQKHFINALPAGSVHIVHTVSEAFEAIGAQCKLLPGKAN